MDRYARFGHFVFNSNDRCDYAVEVLIAPGDSMRSNVHIRYEGRTDVQTGTMTPFSRK